MNPVQLPSGIATGIGGLPHRDASEAAAFVLRTMELPAIPTLPRRSPAEGSMAQAMVGMQGITVGQYGSIAVDANLVDPEAPIVTDLEHDAFLGFRTFLEVAREQQYSGPVKWQFVGPVSFGLVQHLLDAVEVALPGSQQLVFIEEPALVDLMQPGFSIAPDTAIDLVSGALAMVEASSAVSGLHVCGLTDIPSQLAAGPAILSLPVRPEIAESAGYLMRFMEQGGYIAWGVVPTTGPILTSAERPWRQLCALWCELVQRGADPVLLREHAIITPECGLASHTPAVAERVHRSAAEVSRRVRDQATASRWVLGA
jgi:hypothetical protein